MCTLSWHQSSEQYTLLFNRDEQRTRQRALPPSIHQLDRVETIMPIDPDGGGTWISANQYGVSLCLLNFYQGRIPAGKLVSRGQLVKQLSTLKNLGEIESALASLTLSDYAPFSLVIFDADHLFSTTRRLPQLRVWDGQALTASDCPRPYTSSSVKFHEVRQSRVDFFNRLLEAGDQPDTKQLHTFHTGHIGDPGYRSVCLHRDDASSVSLSRIEVNPNRVRFSYHDGAPCKLTETDYSDHIELARI